MYHGSTNFQLITGGYSCNMQLLVYEQELVDMLWCECTPLGSHNIPCSRGDSFCRDTGSRKTGVLLAQLGKQ